MLHPMIFKHRETKSNSVNSNTSEYLAKPNSVYIPQLQGGILKKKYFSFVHLEVKLQVWNARNLSEITRWRPVS